MKLVPVSYASLTMITSSLFFFTVVLTASPIDTTHLARITGGSSAPEHAYPYQVSLQDASFYYYHICSGSILNERWILTAGHCVNSRNGIKLTVLAGTNQLDGAGDRYDVELKVRHELYTSYLYDDIALIRVTKDIVFNEYVSPVILPEEDVEEDNVTAMFSGWGSRQFGELPFNDLQEIELNIISNDVCKKFHNLLTPGHICSFTRIGEGICYGDSGGPLMVKGRQVGIASYVEPCAVGYPDVFTRVYKYIDWIEKTQKKYS